ncbi:MAG TPA: DNA gyrase subunit A [Chitinophagales bacterium]|nr:DNA gyrase subunit A [Chitinophagales bacterium]MCB9075756.1 DNA gyrase subunit A [Chitinophagales bacterium]HMV02609.1 DNA gyrase subunit A [Chitinophagales bacterium]HMZ94737.1 DNA gyrase subunit A [Chitinophagales bacterium]HNB38235.1 DNA gyrase subunit A [Chitinophagales bacterium]
MSEELEGQDSRIVPINIEDQMKSAYIDYSMSVIVSRALPDVRDGLKPVHRRVLYGMQDLGLASNKPHKKSARIVGEVLGKYHPHGDASVYDTMVRMAQDWSLRYPLVDGQGNFGSIDGDPPAAMRYTEARFRKIAEEILQDIDKDTVDFQLNFDDSLKEPTVMPTRIPQLLVNGASGIAVGMATNMLPHNLSEVVDGIVAYIDNNAIEIEELIKYVKAPDFPTGGIIYGYEGIKEAFLTGRGKVRLRGRATIEENKDGRTQIIISEIPYQVQPKMITTRAAELVNDKKIDGIAEIRDESDKDGLRIVFDLKRDAIPNVVLNNLYNFTPLQSSYGINNIALVAGRPQVLNLKDLIRHFVDFRMEVVIRRTQFELNEAEKRAHILEGFMIVLENAAITDEVIALIRKSKNPEAAKDALMERFGLSEIQCKAILALQLSRLTGMEIEKIKEEYRQIMELIGKLKDILDKEALRFEIIKEEILEIKRKYGDERRSEIVYYGDDISYEDMIPEEEMVVTISHLGYVKRTSLDEYKKQNRGGKGSFGGKTRDEDFIEHIFVASTHNYLLLFTELGKCFWLKVYEVPEGSKTAKGRPIQNVINIPQEDKIKAFINVADLKNEELLDSHFIIMATKKGTVKKTSLREYSRPRQNGVNAITVREGDELVSADITNGKCEIILGSKAGKAVRFEEADARAIGRTASGVRGITLKDEADELIGMVCIDTSSELTPDIMVVSENGYGKRSLLEDYRKTARGGKGVTTLNITDKTGELIAINAVTDDNDLMIINKSGLTIRIGLDTIRTMGRNTQGVSLIKLKENDAIAAVTKIAHEEEEEETAENGTDIDNNSIENNSNELNENSNIENKED